MSLSGDQISTDILNKQPSTSRVRFIDAQHHSNEFVIQYALPKIIEMSKLHLCKVGHELYVLVIDRSFAQKPFRIENNVVHKTSVTDCLNQELTYKSPFYVGLSLWVFSERDPRLPENRHDLIEKKEKTIRIESKAKRIREDQFELSAVHMMERKRRAKELDNLESDEDEDEIGDLGKKYTGTFSVDDPMYVAKLHQGYEECRLYPDDRNKYKYLIEKTSWPKHTFIEMPIMPDSLLCHNMDDISKSQGCMYSSGGSFIVNGRERPWILSTRSKFSSNFLFKDKDVDCIENRSAHPVRKLRSSSSTIKCISHKNKHHLLWKIPYVKDFDLPWAVLFKGCGLVNESNITSLVMFCLQSYFRDDRKLSSACIKHIEKLIQLSLLNHDRNSEEIKTQEDAWVYIGKLADKQVEDDLSEDLIAGPLAIDKTEKMSDAIKKQRKRKYASNANGSTQSTTETVDNISELTNEWLRKGRTTICKEILPHVGSDQRIGNEAKHWNTKAVELARMSAKLLLHKSRRFSTNPDLFLSYDNRDEVSNKVVETMSDFMANKLLRPVLQTHIKMARHEIYAALFNESPLDPKTFLDHKRPSNSIDTAISTGTMRTRMNPIISSNGKNNKQSFQVPDTSNRGNAKQAKDKTGVTQLQNNTNVLSIWSTQSRISGNQQSGGISSARAIWDHWGVIDFTETPDNKACGIVHPHALFARISIDPVEDSLLGEVILPSFQSISIDEIISCKDKTTLLNLIMVTLNDRPVMMVTPEVSQQISTFLKNKRYSLMGTAFLSVVNPIETKQLDIYTYGGRLVRPLFVASKVMRLLSPTNEYDKRPLYINLTWEMMLREGFIEYIDKKEEQNDTLIMSNLNDMIKLIRSIYMDYEKQMTECPFTHCEISPVLMMGICSSQIPFCSQNQVSRNVYGSSMGKQAMPSVLMNTATRLDTLMHSLNFATKPLVYTVTLQWFRAESASPGFMAYIAILSIKGKTVEDAIMLNAGTISKGFGRSEQTSVITVTEKRTNSVNITERFQKANRLNTVGMKTQRYEHLDVDGAPFPGTLLTEKDIAISRVGSLDDPSYKKHDEYEKNILKQNGMKLYDNSITVTPKYSGIVTKTILTSDNRGQRKIRLQMKKVCPPLQGDKFCLTPDHQVLTQYGWRDITELTMSDKVACMDEKTHTVLEYQNPSEIYSFDHYGDMYLVDSPQINLATTMNHKMWIKNKNNLLNPTEYELVQAQSIWEAGLQSVLYQKNIINSNPLVPITLSKSIVLKTNDEIYAWLTIVGILIDSSSQQQRCEKYKYETHGLLINSADTLGIKFKIEYHQQQRKYVMLASPEIQESSHWQQWFQQQTPLSFFGLTQSLSLLTQDHCKFLLDILTSSVSSTTDDKFVVPNTEFANLLQQIALHAGISADIHNNETIEILINNYLSIENNPDVISDQHTTIVNGYKGRVYCLQVPSHVFYVRRNGKACWTGNSSRHAQKVTVGQICKESDFIYSKSGIIPDACFNPHGIPSRMTSGHVTEKLAGLAALVYGKRIDGTPFSKEYQKCIDISTRDCQFFEDTGFAASNRSIENIRKQENNEEDAVDSITHFLGDALEKKGFKRHGTEIFYHGETGQRLGKMGSREKGAGEIFYGPMFMYKLTHRGEDKLHARANGPRNILTRQPVEGGAKNGGYRMGSMEVNCVQVYGAAYLLRERHFLVSDAFATHICTRCGYNYQPNFEDKLFWCYNCGSDENCGAAPLSYTFKVLVQTLESACIFPRYMCSKAF